MLIEGPYGAFTHHVRRSDRVVLIGAGVGVTPLRALLEDLPDGVEVSVIVRASAETELVHHDEISALVNERRGSYHALIGSRSKIQLDRKTLRKLVPDIADCDIYICGPGAFSSAVSTAAEQLGVSPDRIHLEVFSF